MEKMISRAGETEQKVGKWRAEPEDESKAKAWSEDQSGLY